MHACPSQAGLEFIAIAGLEPSEGWLPGSNEGAVDRSMRPKKLSMMDLSAAATLGIHTFPFQSQMKAPSAYSDLESNSSEPATDLKTKKLFGVWSAAAVPVHQRANGTAVLVSDEPQTDGAVRPCRKVEALQQRCRGGRGLAGVRST